MEDKQIPRCITLDDARWEKLRDIGRKPNGDGDLSKGIRIACDAYEQGASGSGEVSAVDRFVMLRLADDVYAAGNKLPKCDNEGYEDGFTDALNYFAREIKVKIQAT